jgi:hypothetical protein
MKTTMPIRAVRSRRSDRQDSCNDEVVGAILSGWRYDISGISPAMRVDYEEHLAGCAHCRRRQRGHRVVDVLLLCAFTLSFVAFLLAVLVIHRLEVVTHIANVHLALHPNSAAVTRIPTSITISLQAVAVCGLVLSTLLWVLVAIATPIPTIVTGFVRQRVSPEMRDRLSKHAA